MEQFQDGTFLIMYLFDCAGLAVCGILVAAHDFFKKLYLFTAVPVFTAQVFPSCGRGYSLTVACGLLALASLVGEHRLV